MLRCNLGQPFSVPAVRNDLVVFGFKDVMPGQTSCPAPKECSIAALQRPIGAAIALLWYLAGCAASPPPAVTAPAPPKTHVSPAPDWFHRQLALAQHARTAFVPHGDQAGAQRAYYKVMVPACQRVDQSGLDKYRARCAALVRHAAAAAAADAVAIIPPPDDFSCNDDRDDSHDDQSQVKACND